MDTNMETDAAENDGDNALMQEEIDAKTRQTYRNIRDRLNGNLSLPAGCGVQG